MGVRQSQSQQQVEQSRMLNITDNDSTICTVQNVDLEIADQCQYWLEGVMLTFVGMFGILGNSLSITILSGSNMRNSTFNILLIVLILFDNTFIIFAMLDYACVRVFSWPISIDSSVYALLFPKLLYPLNNISICCSIGLTIAISIERYTAVCHPFYYRESLAGRSITSRVLMYVIPVIVISTIINIPKFLETELVYGKEVDTENVTVRYISYDLTELRGDPDYIRYYQNWCRLILTCVLPVGALVFFNTRIFQGIKYTHQKATNRAVSGELNLATVLICIVVVFIICHIPRVILNCAEFFMLDQILNCPDTFTPPNWNLCLASVNHALLIVNASINFIIYTSVGDSFKLSLKQKIFRMKSKFSSSFQQEVTIGETMIETQTLDILKESDCTN